MEKRKELTVGMMRKHLRGVPANYKVSVNSCYLMKEMTEIKARLGQPDWYPFAIQVDHENKVVFFMSEYS